MSKQDPDGGKTFLGGMVILMIAFWGCVCGVLLKSGNIDWLTDLIIKVFNI